MNIGERVKVKAVANGAVRAETFTATVESGTELINWERVEGELAFYATALAEGQFTVSMQVESTNGEMLGAIVQIFIDPAPATEIVIEVTPA